MRITLTVTEGPHEGLEFMFAQHDTFLVGRSKHAHFQLPAKDKYFSRIHFMMEVNPPQCRLIDMASHNGTYVNSQRVYAADLHDGDVIRAGHTVFRLSVQLAEGESLPTPSGATPLLGVNLLPAVAGFDLVRLLGQGRLGSVFEAHRQSDGASVAIKIIAPTFSGSTTQLDKVLEHTKPLCQLDHPRIVRYLDQGVADDLLYFVCEYVPGRNAGLILQKEGPLPIERVLQWIGDVLLALEYAHARGFVHRDIKPSNLLVTPDDHVKLADFGLARIYQESLLSGLSMTTPGQSIAYLPPEQITNYGQVAPAADQYMAAATLYTLLTGAYLFDFPDEGHLQFSLILHQKPVPILSRRPDIPPKLAEFIHKALARNPVNRFASVADFRQALISLL